MITIKFQYLGLVTTIQALNKDKLRDICFKYAQKVRVDMDKLNYLYSGKLVNLELTPEQIMNKADKERKIMSIIAFDSAPTNCFVESPFVICPKCKEPALFEIENYKFKIYGCKNGHTNDNILLNDIEKTQLIDESKIICGKCKLENKSNTLNNQMYICNLCNIYLCPSCKSKHDKKHIIIDYKDKYFICNKHNKEYNYFCEKCNKN